MRKETYHALYCRLLLVGQFLQCIAERNVRLGPFTGLGILRLLLSLLRREELTAAQGRPGRNTHALVLAHGNNLSLHVPEAGVPLALVHGEWSHPVGARDCAREFCQPRAIGFPRGHIHELAFTTTHAGVSETPKYNICLAMTRLCRCVITSSTDVAKSHLRERH